MVTRVVNGDSAGNLDNPVDYFGVEDDRIAVQASGGEIKTFLGNDVVDAMRSTGTQSANLGYGNDIYYGGTGSDLVQDSDGNDFVTLGAGDDTLDVGGGNDVYVGGSGNDIINFFSQSYSGVGLIFTNNANVVFDLAKTTVQNLGVFGIDKFSGFESVQGGDGNDAYFGTSGVNTLNGWMGNDWLDGRAGNDTLLGAPGADVLIGGLGKDTMYATYGVGDVSRDRFLYRSVADSGISTGTRDDIYDFVRSPGATGDRIDLHMIDADPSKPGNQAFKFVFGFHANAYGEVKVVNQGVNTLVRVDIDRDPASEMTILVHGVNNMKPVDFIL